MEKDARKVQGKEIDVEVATELAAAVRAASVKAALSAYENARMDGLCHEGAWEAAVGAIRMLDVERIVAERGDREAGR